MIIADDNDSIDNLDNTVYLITPALCSPVELKDKNSLRFGYNFRGARQAVIDIRPQEGGAIRLPEGQGKHDPESLRRIKISSLSNYSRTIRR